MTKRILQIVLAVGGSIAVITGLMGAITGAADKLYGLGDMSVRPVLDSNLRYFSGLWLGTGVALLWGIASLEGRAESLRVLALLIFLGGVGRLVSIVQVGNPGELYLLFTVAELLFPLVLLLHRSVVRNR